MRALTLIFCFLVWSLAATHAQKASVTITPNPASVGETVQLLLNVDGVADISAAPELEVEGAYVEYVTTLQEFETSNSAIRMRLSHVFQLTPQRVGTLKIPAFSVRADGRTLRTQPVELKVTSDKLRKTAAQDAFVEWVIPKSTVYVNEVVPLELRIYLASDIRWRLQEYIAPFSADGLIALKMVQKEGGSSRVQRDGRSYGVVTFQTGFSATKTGPLTLPTSEIKLIAQKNDRRGRQRLPRGFEDFFGDDDPFGVFGATRQESVVIHTRELELEVKPLPKDGRPADFTGAVGQFTLKTRATPGRVKLGDPVTLTSEIAGVGNFGLVKAPVPTDATGWRFYPATEQFEEGDQIGLTGVKRFEQAIIPETAHTALPTTVFSYFDPAQEKYVTLKSEPIPIIVEGSAASSPTPKPQSATASAATPTATPAPTDGDRLLYIRHDRGGTSRIGFAPEWRRPLFWLVQAVSLIAWLLMIALVWQQRRLADGPARRLATLKRQASAASAELDESDPATFWSAAVRWIQNEAAIKLAVAGIERDPATLDEGTLCHSIDPALCEEIRQIFAEHDALHYAGSGGRAAVSADRRHRVQEAIEAFRKSSWSGS